MARTSKDKPAPDDAPAEGQPDPDAEPDGEVKPGGELVTDDTLEGMEQARRNAGINPTTEDHNA